jgi:serine/threonine protein kinase
MDEESIFLQALKKPTTADRLAFLEQACFGNAELRRSVAGLLQAHDRAGSFLQGNPGLATIDGTATERPGTVIGPYKLLEQIGEGGFGVVFMAEQQQAVRRKVALKVIKPGMDSRQVIARFEAERQALALMDHPNIARVFDGGETAGGRPYFVMELVKGVPITDYCDQSQMTPKGRLQLFIHVCQAVQHAHQKGIIHRDIKPSNVLVTLHDGTPVVKVIDFGIAKATGQQLTDKTLFTNFAQMIGTPLYMSPEQAALSGLDVDTRSDIYSLGVLLYELLTGKTPFDKERFRAAGYDEIRRIIREEEPPRPSMRVSTLAVAAATPTSTQRLSDPKRLCHLFRGELDWIVMKSLEKDRNRRYVTANALAMDIQRYLHDEPVLACQPSAGYRLRKFVRRNKAAMFAAGLIAATLVLGTLISTWQWIRAMDAERLAETRLETAKSEREHAREEQRNAQKSEFQGKHRLYDSLFAQAQASRWSGQVGRRFKGVKAVAEAAKLIPILGLDSKELLKLRNEAIACMALVDLRLDQKRPGYPPGSTLTGIAFDAEMERYARVDGNGNITVRRLASDEETVLITDIGAPALPERKPDWRMSLCFSSDGKFLAAAGDRRLRVHVPMQVWDLKGPKLLLKAEPSWDQFGQVVHFSPDSRLLAANRDDGSVSLYDVSAAKELKRFALSQRMGPLRFHPQGRMFAVCCGSRVHFLDLEGNPTMPPLSHPRPVSMLSWTADGQLLATACEDEQAYIWDVTTGKQQAICSGHRGVFYVAFSQRGDLLASASGTETRLWDPWTGKELLGTTGLATDFSADDRWLGLGVFGPDVGRWEVAGGQEYRSLHGHPGDVAIKDINSDGRLLASAAS